MVDGGGGVRRECGHALDADGTEFSYERREADFTLQRFPVAPEVAEACAACPRHGRNFSCPPHSPSFAAYLRGCRTATVIALQQPLPAAGGDDLLQCHRQGFQRLCRLLVEELLQQRAAGHLVLGSGPCLGCSPCALEQGEPRCADPDRRIYSLEATGVHVTRLMRDALGVELEWTDGVRQATTVWAVGAVFGR